MLLLLLQFLAGLGLCMGLPMQVTINQRQAECLHDKLEEGCVDFCSFVLESRLFFGIALSVLSLDFPLLFPHDAGFSPSFSLSLLSLVLVSPESQ